MPHHHRSGEPPRTPTPQELRVISLVPLLAPFYRDATVRDLMPEPLLSTMESSGLTPRHGAVLPHLLAGRPLAVSEIARRLHVSVPTASELVGGLNRAGIVVRTEDPANRRRILVSVSEEYLPALEAFVTRRSEPLLRALEDLTPDQREGFVAGLTAWVRAVQD